MLRLLLLATALSTWLLGPAPDAHAQPGLVSPEPIAPYLDGAFPTSAPGSSTGDWIQVDYYPSLTFVEPLRIVEHPIENRLLIVGKDGMGWLVTHEPGSSDKVLFFDIRSIMQGKAGVGEGGISDLVFHPEFGDPGSPNAAYVYLSYRWAPPGAAGAGTLHGPATVDGYNRVSRFSVVNGTVDLSTELVLINQYDREQWHIGGDMLFGSDGFLYISVGDEGNCCNRQVSTQRLDGGLWSGILRIDVDQDPTRSHPIRRQPTHLEESPLQNGGNWIESFTQAYFIPNDNPFVDPSGGQLEEFYSLGLRHPWTISLDPATGNLWAADVGQSSMEEIDLVSPGSNHQWAYAEGTLASGPIAKPANPIGVEMPPVWAYPRSQGQSVIGGGVYRGLQFPELIGKYLFSDFISGSLWTATPNGSGFDIEEIGAVTAGFPNGVNSYLLDSKGNILMAKTSGGQDPGGAIQTLVRAGSVPPTPEPPATLTQTGAFESLADLTPHSGCIPYALNVPFWSDASEKARWMCVPNDGDHDTEDEKIGFSEEGSWDFPEGSVLIKHFELQGDPNDPATTVRTETRFLVHSQNGPYGVTYRWDEFGVEAYLLTTEEDETYTLDTPSGPVEQDWHFPGRNECLTCHSAVAGATLGANTRQLNRSLTYPETGIEANQLETLNALGMLEPPIEASELPAFLASTLTSTPTNSSGSLSARARSYLDANCGYCHRPGGVRANFDARLSTPLHSQGLVDGSLAESLGIEGEAVVVPGDLTRSVLFVRADSAGESFSMPPLAKSLVDVEGMAVISEWIHALEGFSVGNATDVGGAFIDGHHPSLYINEQDVYAHDDGDGSVFAKRFQFYAQRPGNPVTPLVVRVDGDNAFTVLAIGTTRTSADYSIGSNDIPFSDAGDVEIPLSDGDVLATGFMDAYPDGSGWGAGTVIPAEAGSGASQDEIYALLPSPLISQTSGFDPARDTASVALGQSIAATNAGKALASYDLHRSYRFAVTLGLAGGDGTPPTNGPMLANGSFEAPVVTDFTVYTDPYAIPGWTITAGSVELDRTPWPASEGAQSIDLNGDGPGRIEQTVTGFVPDATYRLEFDYALHASATTTQSADVLLDGSVLATLTADLTMKPPSYAPFATEFVADSETATIGFAGLDSGSMGVVIDDVRLEFVAGPIPECTADTNIAALGSATQSSEYSGGQFPAHVAIDGNYSNFTHTQSGQVDPWWRLEYDDDVSIDEIVLHNRTSCCGSRLRDITVTVEDSLGDVFTSPLLNPENVLSSPSQIVLDLVALEGAPVVGKIITISRTSDPDLSGGTGNAEEADVLSLAEVEVFGCAVVSPPPEPEPSLCASGKPNLLINGSFEETSHPNYASAADLIVAEGGSAGGIPFLDAHPDTDIPGWFTTGGIPLQQGGVSQGGTIELGLSGFLGAVAPDGEVIVEMDGNHHNQNIWVVPGDVLEWEFAHRGRFGTDRVAVRVRPLGEDATPLAEVSSSNLAWLVHTGAYEVPNDVYRVQLSITPTAASDGDIDSSNLLDDVKLCGEQIPVPEPRLGPGVALMTFLWMNVLNRRRLQAHRLPA